MIEYAKRILKPGETAVVVDVRTKQYKFAKRFTFCASVACKWEVRLTDHAGKTFGVYTYMTGWKNPSISWAPDDPKDLIGRGVTVIATNLEAGNDPEDLRLEADAYATVEYDLLGEKAQAWRCDCGNRMWGPPLHKDAPTCSACGLIACEKVIFGPGEKP